MDEHDDDLEPEVHEVVSKRSIPIRTPTTNDEGPIVDAEALDEEPTVD